MGHYLLGVLTGVLIFGAIALGHQGDINGAVFLSCLATGIAVAVVCFWATDPKSK